MTIFTFYLPKNKQLNNQIMARKRHFHRENCDSRVRATITDKWGRTISLLGTHAFEWEIVIESCGKITIQSYHNGSIARKEFNNYKRKR